MDLEFSVSGEPGKRQALETLAEAGYEATSGSVRVAHPFSVRVLGITETDVEPVRTLIGRVDPGALIIWSSGSLAAR